MSLISISFPFSSVPYILGSRETFGYKESTTLEEHSLNKSHYQILIDSTVNFVWGKCLTLRCVSYIKDGVPLQHLWFPVAAVEEGITGQIPRRQK